MTDNGYAQIARHAHDLMAEDGYSCTEAILLAVGEHLWGEVSEEMRRVATPFGGGVGSTKEELCGALSGAVMVIGAVHGRTDVSQDKTKSREAAARYREAFIDAFGETQCKRLLDTEHGQDCAVLVEKATLILLETLESEA